MCVIIDKLPGKSLNFEMLLSAAVRNPDGWGIVMHDGTTAEVRKGLSKPGYAAEAVSRALEELKDEGRALIHFRFRTQGDRTPEMAHPFQILDKEKDGLGLWLMHNGTFTEFSGKWQESDWGESDTKKFVTQIVEPLSRLVVKGGGDPSLLLADPLFSAILDKYAGTGNKVSLIDHTGNVLHINKKGGYDFDWGWASNKYSLESSRDVKRQDWEDAGKEPPQGFFRETKTENTERSNVVYRSGGFTPLSQRATRDEKAANVINYSTNALDQIDSYDPENRSCSIYKVLDITDHTDLFVLDEKQIRKIVKDCPDAAVLMIIDLLYTLYSKQMEEKRLAA